MRNLKRTFASVVLAFHALSLTAGAATIESIQLDAKNVIVRGTSEGSVVTYKVHSKDSEGNQISDVCEMGEAYVNEGEFVIEVTMPEYFKGVKTDGEFVVTVKDEEADSKEFVYAYMPYSAQVRFIESVNGITQGTDLVLLFDGTSEDGYTNLSIMRVLGADTEYYSGLGDDKENFADIFIAESEGNAVTTATFPTVFEKAKTVQYINKYKASLEWLAETDFVFENKKFSEITDTKLKDWILEKINGVITETSQYGAYSEIESKYYEANALYILNSAKHTEYDEKIALYDDIIQIMSEDFYRDYLNMSPNYKNNVNSKVKNDITVSHVNSAEEFRAIYENAVKAVKQSMGSGTGTGSSSGSGSSSGGGMSIIPPETSNPTKEQARFNDLENVEWAKTAIEGLANRGVVAGYEDNTFKPQKNITREEFIKMVVAAQGLRLNVAPCGLADVGPNMWYAPYVNAAYQAGIVKGVSNEEFGIGEEITREDMAVIIARIKNYANADGEQNAFTDDGAISAYAKDAVYSLYKAGKIAGVGDNMFGPKQIVTRAQAAKIIYDTLFAGI